MRHRVSVRRASENAAPAVDSRARPAPIQAKRGGDRIGRSPRPSASRRERHSPGCSCPGCARSAQIARGPAAAESGDVIQLCKNCKDESCKSGEKCGNKKRSVSDVYKTWNPKPTKSVPIETPWGEVSAQHKRGAPYIRSRAKDYKRSKLKTDYKDFNRGLRGGSEKKDKDDLIAQDLLNETSDYLKTPLQKRGASMLRAARNRSRSATLRSTGPRRAQPPPPPPAGSGMYSPAPGPTGRSKSIQRISSTVQTTRKTTV